MKAYNGARIKRSEISLLAGSANGNHKAALKHKNNTSQTNRSPLAFGAFINLLGHQL